MTLDELDRLAAEKVMGWPFRKSAVMGEYYEDPEGVWPTPGEWQPTRQIEQAWQLLENIGFSFSVASGYKSFICFIHKSENQEDCQLTMAETAPLAITKACLKAMGVEVE